MSFLYFGLGCHTCCIGLPFCVLACMSFLQMLQFPPPSKCTGLLSVPLTTALSSIWSCYSGVVHWLPTAPQGWVKLGIKPDKVSSYQECLWIQQIWTKPESWESSKMFVEFIALFLLLQVHIRQQRKNYFNPYIICSYDFQWRIQNEGHLFI